MKKWMWIFLVWGLWTGGPGCMAGDTDPVKPTPRDKCPVCGMFVAKYPDFIAGIKYPDGSYAVFDGAKDLFKFFQNVSKYHPSRKVENIVYVWVTDYYSLEPIDGKKAYYVVGSDVFGPMGRELIPFEKEEDAREFQSDHGGTGIFSFDKVTPELIKGLD